MTIKDNTEALIQLGITAEERKIINDFLVALAQIAIENNITKTTENNEKKQY